MYMQPTMQCSISSAVPSSKFGPKRPWATTVSWALIGFTIEMTQGVFQPAADTQALHTSYRGVAYHSREVGLEENERRRYPEFAVHQKPQPGVLPESHPWAGVSHSLLSLEFTDRSVSRKIGCRRRIGFQMLVPLQVPDIAHVELQRHGFR